MAVQIGMAVGVAIFMSIVLWRVTKPDTVTTSPIAANAAGNAGTPAQLVPCLSIAHIHEESHPTQLPRERTTRTQQNSTTSINLLRAVHTHFQWWALYTVAASNTLTSNAGQDEGDMEGMMHVIGKALDNPRGFMQRFLHCFTSFPYG